MADLDHQVRADGLKKYVGATRLFTTVVHVREATPARQRCGEVVLRLRVHLVTIFESASPD
jgi:hypothetical protein